MYRYVTLVLALLWIGLISPAFAESKWTQVGGNPTNPDTCTVSDYITKVVNDRRLSENVGELLLREVINSRKKTGYISRNDDAYHSVSFGECSISYDVYPVWKEGKRYTTDEYKVTVDNVTYTLSRVWKCGNWVIEIQNKISRTSESSSDSQKPSKLTKSRDNPGNDMNVGNAGERPNSKGDWGDGSRGQGDVKGNAGGENGGKKK